MAKCLDLYTMECINGTEQKFESIIDKLNQRLKQDGILTYARYEQIITSDYVEDTISSWKQERGFISNDGLNNTFALIPLKNCDDIQYAIAYIPNY